MAKSFKNVIFPKKTTIGSIMGDSLHLVDYSGVAAHERDFKTISAGFDSTYLKLDGSNANKNINIGSYAFFSDYIGSVGEPILYGNFNSLVVNIAFSCGGSVGSDLIPFIDNTYDLGSSTKRWAQGWFNDINTRALTITTGDINISSVDLTAATSDSGLFWAGDNVRSGIFTEVNGDVLSFGINVPQADTYDNTKPGIIYRLDSRSNGSFNIIGYKANDTSKFYTIQTSTVGSSTIFYHYNTTTARKAAEFGLSGWGGIFFNSSAGNECDLSGTSVAIQAKGDIHLYNDSDELDFGNGKDWRIYSDGTHLYIDRLVGSGNLILNDIPAADPSVAGALWNDGGTLKISAG